LQQDRNDLVMRNVQAVPGRNKVADSQAVAKAHIVHKAVALRLVQDLVDRVGPDNVPALAAHLEKVARRKRITRVRRPDVKRSTIWRRQQSVAQLFQEEMAILPFDSAGVLH